MKKLFSILLFFIFILSCTTVQDPLTGKPTLTLLSVEQEIEIGRKIVPQAINENEGLYPDEEVQQYVREIGYKLASVTPRKVSYQFYVVNSKDINAFALPGGPVFINRGLLLTLDNESELAGVLAHELGHINARHHAKFLEKTYGMNILLNILAITTANSSYYNLTMELAKISAGLLQLKYSRDQENEADELGIRFTYQADYDPRGLISTFEKFKKMEKDKAPPEWLLTHPLPETRIKNVSQLIATKYPNLLLLKKDSEKFQYIKQKVLKTEESYKYIENAKENIKNKNYSVAITNLDTSIKLYPQNNLAYTYRAYAYYILKNYNKSYEDSYKAYNLDQNYFLPQLIMGASLTKLGKYKESISVLEKAKKLIDSNPDLYYFLGVSYQGINDKQRAYDNLVAALKLSDGKRGWEEDAKNRINYLIR